MITIEESAKMHHLAEAINSVLGVSLAELRSASRIRRLADARKMFCLIARDRMQVRWVAIGEYLNNDHSTCIEAAKQIRGRMEVSEDAADDYFKIIGILSMEVKTDEIERKIDYILNIAQVIDKLKSQIKELSKAVENLQQKIEKDGKEIDWEALRNNGKPLRTIRGTYEPTRSKRKPDRISADGLSG